MRISEIVSEELYDKMIDKLCHYQKHQYCPWHKNNPAKCTTDWLIMASEFFEKAKDSEVPEPEHVEEQPEKQPQQFIDPKYIQQLA